MVTHPAGAVKTFRPTRWPLGADEVRNPRLDAWLADEIVDVARVVLAQAVDPADPSFFPLEAETQMD